MRWIQRASRFFALDVPSQRVFCAALGWCAVLRLALWTLPFEFVQRQAKASVRPVSRRVMPVDRIIEMTELAANIVPGASCLTRSLAGRILLAQAGYAATLRLGARRGASGLFQAHAWLEQEGRVISAGEETTSFVALPIVA